MVENANIDTIIGLNVVLIGNLKNKGSIQVNGNVEGELRSDEHINIGETAKVKGPVFAKTVEVSGEVDGLIETSERLEIHPTGKVVGDLNAKSLIIEQGAVFVGKSNMPSESKVVASHGEGDKTKAPVGEDKTEKAENKEKERDRDPLGFFRK